MKVSEIIIATLFVAFAMVDVASAAEGAVRGTREKDEAPTEDMAEDMTDASERTFVPAFTAYHNAGCRTAHGGVGYEGKDYVRYDYSEYYCRYKCETTHGCKAYEVGRHNHCEIWYTYPPKTEYRSGLTCYKKNGYTPPTPTYNKKYNKACRTSHWGYGKEGRDYDKYYHEYDCEGLCDSLGSYCKAYESAGNGHCEIWKYAPPNYEGKHGFTCAIKY